MKNLFEEDSIIHLNGFVYLVDDEKAPIKDFMYHPKNPTIKDVRKLPAPEKAYEHNGWRQILATNDPSLEGVTKLPDLNHQLTLKSAQDSWAKIPEDQKEFVEPIDWMHGFVSGFEEASKKKYDEEDMMKMHFHGWLMRERYHGPDKTGYEGKYPSNWSEMDYEEREQWYANQRLQSLTPKIKEIELDTVRIPDGDDEVGYYTTELNLDNKGNVIVRRVEYE